MQTAKDYIPGQALNMKKGIDRIEEEMQYLMIAFIAKGMPYIGKAAKVVYALPSNKIINKTCSDGWEISDQCDQQKSRKYQPG